MNTYHYNNPQSTTKARISALLQSDPEQAMAGIRQAGYAPKAEADRLNARIDAMAQIKVQELVSRIAKLHSAGQESRTDAATVNAIVMEFCRGEFTHDQAMRAIKAEGRANFFAGRAF